MKSYTPDKALAVQKTLDDTGFFLSHPVCFGFFSGRSHEQSGGGSANFAGARGSSSILIPFFFLFTVFLWTLPPSTSPSTLAKIKNRRGGVVFLSVHLR